MPTLQLSLKDWNRHRAIDQYRREALQRLYERREAVDDLIRSLEQYRNMCPPHRAECVALSAESRCS
jgi:hypothetical protein